MTDSEDLQNIDELTTEINQIKIEVQSLGEEAKSLFNDFQAVLNSPDVLFIEALNNLNLTELIMLQCIITYASEYPDQDWNHKINFLIAVIYRYCFQHNFFRYFPKERINSDTNAFFFEEQEIINVLGVLEESKLLSSNDSLLPPDREDTWLASHVDSKISIKIRNLRD